MSKFDAIIKSEIRRLAKQEAKKMTQPLVNEIRKLSGRRRGYPRRPPTPPGIRFRTTAVHETYWQ